MNNKFLSLLIMGSLHIQGMDEPIINKKQKTRSIVSHVPSNISRDILSNENFKQCEFTKQSTSWWSLHNFVSNNISISHVSISADGRCVVVTSKDRVYYTGLKDEEPFIFDHEIGTCDQIRSISMNGNYLAIAASKQVNILDVQTGKSKVDFIYPHIVDKLCLSPDGNLLAIASGFKIAIINSKTKESIHGYDVEGTYTTEIKPLIMKIAKDEQGNDDKMCKGVDSLYLADDGDLSIIFSLYRFTLVREVKPSALTGYSPDMAMVKHSLLNTNGKLVVAILNDGIRIIDPWQRKRIDDKTKVYSMDFFKLTGITTACVDEIGNTLVTGSEDGTLRIFKKYTDYALDQSILKSELLKWFLIEKPSRKINSLDMLLQAVQSKSPFELTILENGWRSFPENMQRILLSTMLYRIQKYGKDPVLL